MEKSRTFQRLFSAYGGVLMAALYGLAVRLLVDDVDFSMGISLFSVIFLGALPFAIACSPILVASETQLSSWKYLAGIPALSVLVLMLISYWTRLQDWLWALTISAPFVVAAVLCGFLTGYVVRRVRKIGVQNRE